MSTDPGATTLIDLSGEVHGEALLPGAERAGAQAVVDMHLRIAARLGRQGAPLQALQEVTRAARAVPLTGRLAAAVVAWSLRARAAPRGAALLADAAEDLEGPERPAVLRQQARLARRAGDLARAQAVLTQALAEGPQDRRARVALNAVLAQAQQWEALDASLAAEAGEAARRQQWRAASRSALRRARLWGETLDEPVRAAASALQAAQFADQARQPHGAFLLRLLWLRGLHRARAPARALREAAQAVLLSGERAGQRASAEALVEELDLRQDDTAEGLPVVALEAPAPAAPAPRRHSTQLELVAVAEVAEAQGHAVEAAALLAAAVREGPEPTAAQRLEAHLVQRGAWRELAAFYRDALGRAASKPERARWAEKLAELLESELGDVAGAASAWGAVVEASGDPRAVTEQVRLLEAAQDASGAREALDLGVAQAAPGPERAQALLLRAEAALARHEDEAAQRDFEAALALVPETPAAAAGLAELAAQRGEPAPARALEAVLGRLPRGSPGRGDLFRRLARLCDSPLRDGRASRAAWAEVLRELPGDEEATARLGALLRAAGDDGALEALLRDELSRTPRGPRARLQRLELVALLDRAGRAAEALDALQGAVRAEPGHREAWLTLAERLVADQRDREAAWALEHAAGATADDGARLRLWERLARFVRERLGDEARAAAFEARAERMRRDLLGNAPAPARPAALPGGPLMTPRRRPSAPRPEEDFEGVAAQLGARPEPQQPSRAHARVAPRATKVLGAPSTRPAPLPPPVPDEVDVPTPTAELPLPDEVEAAPAEAHAPPERSAGPTPATAEAPEAEERRTAELPVELGDPSTPLAPSFGPSPAKVLSQERQALFERVRAAPLDPDGYRLLAEHFDAARDATRSSLMLEIARALEGDPHAMPRTPRLILNATDRAGLKHPTLRTEAGELLNLLGVALCRLHPARGPDADTAEEFHLEAGRGARATADALLAAVRILGQRAPEVFLSEEPGPPFSVAYTTEPRLLVGSLAARRELPGAELRFFAGRALFTLQPELLALRTLRREELLRGLVVATQVAEGRGSPVETKLVRDAVPARGWERARALLRTAARRLDLAQLMDGARHSSNRAGLVVCGGIAPAVASLRAKKALPSEMIELVRYAASERYLQLRNRVLPSK